MHLQDFVAGHTLLSLTAALILVVSSLGAYLFRKQPILKNAPAYYGSENTPLLGALNFFTQRYDFWQRARSQSKTGNFSFHAGKWAVVGVSGLEERKVFLESKALDMVEGYGKLLAAAPEVKENNNLLAENVYENADFTGYFQRRLMAMLKGNQLKQGLPKLLSDARTSLDKLAADPKGMTDPFDSIYSMVFQFTMRTVACNDIADDPAQLATCLHHYETVEAAASPIAIMWPWIPLLSKLRRTYAGAQLYFIFKKIVDNRTATGAREDDALQFLMDHGDNITDIITFVLGALFAGQLNSGINAAWILCYLANDPYWMKRVREEVDTVADRYCADKSLPLKDRLMQVPIEAWESEFPLIDFGLKDTIRLQMHGTAFRRNLSNQDVAINKNGEVIPPGGFAAMHVADIHYNPEIYPNPGEWNPGRYLPDKAEDKKVPYAWMGWGIGRHPCLGMRFAKLENTLIVAFFLAYFSDIEIADKSGKKMDRPSETDLNFLTAHKPKVPMYLKYKVRTD